MCRFHSRSTLQSTCPCAYALMHSSGAVRCQLWRCAQFSADCKDCRRCSFLPSGKVARRASLAKRNLASIDTNGTLSSPSAARGMRHTVDARSIANAQRKPQCCGLKGIASSAAVPPSALSLEHWQWWLVDSTRCYAAWSAAKAAPNNSTGR